jgi:hypothetical protein
VTPDDQQKLLAFLNEKWASSACPQCKKNDWRSLSRVTLIVQDLPGKAKVSGPSLPLGALTCGNCGHTELINLMIAGIHQPTKRPPSEQED